MIRRGNLLWEGLSTETKPTYSQGGGDSMVFKELDTGDTYERRAGQWLNLSAGYSFIKATKSGSVTTNANGQAHVTFVTPFINAQYTVALSTADMGSVKPALAFFSNLTNSGFDIQTRDSKQGNPHGGVPVSWVATRDFNT